MPVLYAWLFVVFTAAACFTIGYIAGRESKGKSDDEP